MKSIVIRIGQSTRAKYSLALAFICCLAFFWRVYFPFDNVFVEDWVRFQINDPWHAMRIVENLVHHFPHISSIDPYGLYPEGQPPLTGTFFVYLLGFFIWLFGAGSPSMWLIERIGAFFPAILGALVTIPVYFIGKELFNRKAGLLAAALIAILPGQFLMRSLLGFTDHHAAEVLFSTLTMLFLILAVKSAKANEVTFEALRNKDWGILRKPLIYSALTGIALGLYLLTWTGGSLFIFIIVVFAVIQYVIVHSVQGRSTDYLAIVGIPAFIIALILIAPAANDYSLWNIQFAALVIGIITFAALSVISNLMSRRNIKRFYYPVTLAALLGIGLLLFWAADRSLYDLMMGKLSVFNPTGGELTVSEMKGISLDRAWEELTTAFYLSLISLPVIGYLVIKEGEPTKTLLFVWCLVMLVAMFGQVRFVYYFAVNAALLAAYFSWRILELAGIKETTEEHRKEQLASSTTKRIEVEKSRKSKKAKRRKEKAQRKRQEAPARGLLNSRLVYGLIALVVVFFLAFYPNIGKSIEWADARRGASDAWRNVLVWMSENTPEPFDNPDFYYELYEGPASGNRYEYPESAYGVMSWWDYGYWITYIAHRIPNANPGKKKAEIAGSYFIDQDEASANQILNEQGTKYVITDRDMAQGKFYAMVEWAGGERSDFFEPYYRKQGGGYVLDAMLYYPEYYESICSRLYNFDGETVIPSNDTWVISYNELKSADGRSFKEITGIANNGEPFATYEEAVAFVGDSSNYRIVGQNPTVSPVPLEKLEHYQLVYQSPHEAGTAISLIKLFEYTP